MMFMSVIYEEGLHEQIEAEQEWLRACLYKDE